jgi:hypothetical protein
MVGLADRINCRVGPVSSNVEHWPRAGRRRRRDFGSGRRAASRHAIAEDGPKSGPPLHGKTNVRQSEGGRTACAYPGAG